MTITTTFARLVGGQIQYAPKPLRVSGSDVYTNDPNIYHANGWYTVILATPLPPVSGLTIVESWSEDDESMTITQSLSYAPSTTPVEERVDELESVQTELAEQIANSTHDLEVIYGVIDYIIMNLI